MLFDLFIFLKGYSNYILLYFYFWKVLEDRSTICLYAFDQSTGM